MERLIVKLFKAPANELPPSEVQQLGKRFGVEFVPLHPGVSDDALGAYFYCDVGSEPLDAKLIDELRQCESVDGAYVKSEGEPPIDNM